MTPETLQLLYPLGYLSSFAFGLRFLVQWFYSESLKKSVVVKSFWQLSILGNLLLFVHSLIQMQLPISLIQAINGVISWRNINLMGSDKEKKSFSFTWVLMLLCCLSTFLFYIICLPSWFRVPDSTLKISWGWHLLGTLGIVLFASRFIVQWWQAEKEQRSVLGLSFWWISLAGGLLSALYFAMINDPVNLIGPLIGTIPYLRNLILLKRQKALT